MAYNPYYAPTRSGPPRVRFSRVEIRHLAIAVAFLTVAFAFIRAPGGQLDAAGRGEAILQNPLILVASFLAVSSGFVLHELGHKVLAQRYGHWAEFRAQLSGLGISLLIAVFARILFAAPGAVLIMGNVTRRENGLISLIGPAINFLIAAATVPVTLLYVNQDDPVPMIFGTIAIVNAVLAVFNLIPLGPLDGKKVWAWNKATWTIAFLVSLALMLFTSIQVL